MLSAPRRPALPRCCRYVLGSVLGAGSFGVVREATEKRTKRRYAVKTIPKRCGCKGWEEGWAGVGGPGWERSGKEGSVCGCLVELGQSWWGGASWPGGDLMLGSLILWASSRDPLLSFSISHSQNYLRQRTATHADSPPLFFPIAPAAPRTPSPRRATC